MMNIQRPVSFHGGLNSNNRVLIKSSSSFSILEDKIIVPTPRKLQNVHSPVPKRKNTQESILFGEAGQELQTILFQGFAETTDNKLHIALGSDDSSIPKQEEGDIAELLQLRANHHSFVDNNVKVPRLLENDMVMDEDDSSISSLMSPPLRSTNPLTMNSPFHRINEDHEGSSSSSNNNTNNNNTNNKDHHNNNNNTSKDSMKKMNTTTTTTTASATTITTTTTASGVLPALRIVTSKFAPKSEKRSSKDLSRYRSASWPALSKLVTTE